MPGPKHARADVGRTNRGRALLAAAAASLVALTGLSGVALASDEDPSPTPSPASSSRQTDAAEGVTSDETQPTGDADTISSGTAGSSSAAPGESATVDAHASIQALDAPIQAAAANGAFRYWMTQSSPQSGSVVAGTSIVYNLCADVSGSNHRSNCSGGTSSGSTSINGAVIKLELTDDVGGGLVSKASLAGSTTFGSVATSGGTATWTLANNLSGVDRGAQVV